MFQNVLYRDFKGKGYHFSILQYKCARKIQKKMFRIKPLADPDPAVDL